MHEYPLTESIIKLATATAKENSAVRISRISLVVGELSGFIGDSIVMYFDILSQGTMAEGAKLSIRYIKPKLSCPQCGQLFERKRFDFKCPNCQVDGVPTEIGKEFFIEDIEIES